MTKDQCISITDLRTKTKQYVTGLDHAPKYVFINNKPIAVLVDIDEYEDYFSKTELVELKESQISTKLRKKAKQAQQLKKSELARIQN